MLDIRRVREDRDGVIAALDRRGGSFAAEIDRVLALDARRMLDDMSRRLPADCAGVVLDVCGLLKGLQEVELERGWPRRSAKLVLRIGLEQLAQHYGMAGEAHGPEHGRQCTWIGPEGRPRGLY